MRIWTLDFETYYSTDYSLSKISTTEYIRSELFEPILVGIRPPDSPAFWLSAPQFDNWLEQGGAVELSNSAVLAHHAAFDGAILSWRYGIRPKLWLDTLSMSRYVLGGKLSSHALSSISSFLGIGAKGFEVIHARGKHLADFTAEELNLYGGYCVNDCELAWKIFSILAGAVPQQELRVIDAIIRMYTEPAICLDSIELASYLAQLTQERNTMEVSIRLLAGIGPTEIMSNKKFAELLTAHGVSPPQKISPRTGKLTYAFAKTDQELLDLQDHPNSIVQTLVAARLGLKSTIAQTRAKAFLYRAQEGTLPIYLNYCGAQQTNRLSGGDSVNAQNLPRGSVLRDALVAPEGYVFIVVDSSNIEARGVDTLAVEQEAIQAYRDYDAGIGPDIYCYMASKLYGRSITEYDVEERRLGKITKLGCGYGVGSDKYVDTARLMGVNLTGEEGHTYVQTYRSSHRKVKQLWTTFHNALPDIQAGVCRGVDEYNLVRTCADGLQLPSGFVIKYPDLQFDPESREWSYRAGRIRARIYGGKMVENVVQALARDIVMWQSLSVVDKAPSTRWVHSVHDEAVFLAPEALAPIVLEIACEVFRTPPSWWAWIPLNVKGGIAKVYGRAKV